MDMTKIRDIRQGLPENSSDAERIDFVRNALMKVIEKNLTPSVVSALLHPRSLPWVELNLELLLINEARGVYDPDFGSKCEAR